MENPGDSSPTEKEALVREFRDLDEIRTREAKSRAVVLEILGDIPDADITPPKNVLFVCKLNPVTEEGDLKIIFSRFGNVKKCDIIKDYVTGDSLQYAFIEFETEDSCNEAYFKMQNVLIDDRRIHVDFCQSVSGFWKKYYFKENFTRRRTDSRIHRKTDRSHRRSKSYEGRHKRTHSHSERRSPERDRRSPGHYRRHHNHSRRSRRSRSRERGSRRHERPTRTRTSSPDSPSRRRRDRNDDPRHRPSSSSNYSSKRARSRSRSGHRYESRRRS